MLFNLFTRPATTVLAGFAYVLIESMFKSFGLPIISATDLLSFEHSWMELVSTALVMSVIYIGVCWLSEVFIRWAFMPSRALLESTGNMPPREEVGRGGGGKS